tara:strand:+ start:871 stop:1074 length:204 start_codon:yes stop_codon:yes gene_type:complete
MKKAIILVALMTLTVGFTSCRETTTEKETVVREVEVDETDDGGILERAGKEVDDEVNEEIDKIGDDN